MPTKIVGESLCENSFIHPQPISLNIVQFNVRSLLILVTCYHNIKIRPLCLIKADILRSYGWSRIVAKALLELQRCISGVILICLLKRMLWTMNIIMSNTIAIAQPCSGATDEQRHSILMLLFSSNVEQFILPSDCRLLQTARAVFVLELCGLREQRFLGM